MTDTTFSSATNYATGNFPISFFHPTPVVFIDSAVDDLEGLVKGVVAGTQVIILDPNQNGLTQITSALQGRTDLGEVHIVSHGSPGCLYLGNAQLSLDTLQKYAPQLQTWFTTSSSSPSLLLYGCQVAAGDAGEEFIEQLHQLTGAEIAASANLTGSILHGGDWELEVGTGDFTRSLAFLPQVMENSSVVFLEPNDTLAQATVTGINGAGSFSTSGSIGDNPNNLGADVDLYRVQLNAGNFITASVDASIIGSGLDSYLRLFDSNGNELTNDDDSGSGSDSAIRFAAPTTGTYYLGVSSYGGRSYNPSVEGSSSGSGTGNYNININTSLFGPSATLATAPGDGGVRISLDAYGSFGSSINDVVSDAFYNPVGSLGESGTVYESAVAIRLGNIGERTFLSSGDIGTSGNLSSVIFTATSPTSAQSSFTYNGLNIALDQRVSDLFDPTNARTGSQLTQTYTLTNPGSTAVNFELTRYLDGDLNFDGTLYDRGGYLLREGKDVLFETDSGGSPFERTTFVGIAAVGGNALPGKYEIDVYNGLENRIIDGVALDNTSPGIATMLTTLLMLLPMM